MRCKNVWPSPIPNLLLYHLPVTPLPWGKELYFWLLHIKEVALCQGTSVFMKFLLFWWGLALPECHHSGSCNIQGKQWSGNLLRVKCYTGSVWFRGYPVALVPRKSTLILNLLFPEGHLLAGSPWPTGASLFWEPPLYEKISCYKGHYLQRVRSSASSLRKPDSILHFLQTHVSTTILRSIHLPRELIS